MGSILAHIVLNKSYIYNVIVGSGDAVLFFRFVFIIGTSVVFAFKSLQRRGLSYLQLLRKVTWRTAVLLLLGFCFLNYSPKDGPRKWETSDIDMNVDILCQAQFQFQSVILKIKWYLNFKKDQIKPEVLVINKNQ